MKRYILLADQDTTSRQAVGAVAERFGVEAVFADDEAEAQKRFIEFGPEVVIADVLLPRRGPFEFLRRVRNSRSGGEKAIIVTNSLRVGANAYAALVEEVEGTLVDKPLEVERLAALLAPRLTAKAAVGGDGPLWRLGGYIADEGAFDRQSFPLVLAHACFSAAPTRLAVTRGKAKKVLTFASSRLTFAVSNVFTDTLARHLLSRGIVTETAYRQAIEMVVESRMRIGEAFLSLGAIDQTTLEAALRRNMLEKALDLFSWEEGFYRLITYEEPPVTIPGEEVRGEALLWSVVREQVSPEGVKSSFLRSCGSVEGPLNEGRPLTELPGGEVFGSVAPRLSALARAAPKIPFRDFLASATPENLLLVYFLLLTGFLRLPVDTEELPVDPLERKALEEMSARCDWMRTHNAFRILGVGFEANDAEVEEAYGKVREELKASAAASGGPGSGALRLACKAEDALALAKRAYTAIATARARNDYIASLSDYDNTVGDEGRQFKAEAAHRQGLEALTMMDWQKAFEAFSRAASLNPAEPEYLLYAGIARRHQETPSRREALKSAESLIKEASESLTKSAEPFYQLGRIQEALGEAETALESYAFALERDPTHNRTRKRLKFLADRNTVSLGGKIRKILKLT